MNKIFMTALIVATCLFMVGCQNTPFVTINVPKTSELVPEYNVYEEQDNIRLKELHEQIDLGEKLLPGDKFNIIVENQPNLSARNVLIMRNGKISVSPIGSVEVAGKTIDELENELKEKYAKYVANANIIIEPVKFEESTITILGAVGSPGTYNLPLKTMYLTGAISMANGLARSHAGNSMSFEIADLSHAILVRDGEILPVDFIAAIMQGNQLHNIPIHNNDYIYIPSLEDRRVTVIGEVYSPSSFPYQPRLTLLQAVGFANGLKDTYSRHVKVIRGGLTNPVVYNINILDMQEGRKMDFLLKPNDIVFIPKDGLSDWNVIMQHLLPTIQVINGLAGPFGNEGSVWY